MRRYRKRGIGKVPAGLITIAVLVIATYFAFAKSVPFEHHYTVRAMFANANIVQPNSPVRIAGVDVGKVSKVQVVHPGSPAAVVSMTMESQGLPLHSDATFKVRPRIFLEGNFFVDVSPGSPHAPVVGDGHLFPVNQTAAPVQFDQLLTTLQASTRTDLQTLLQVVGHGLSGGGAQGYHDSIPYWLPAYRDGSLVSEATLGEDRHDLSQFIAHSGAVAQALDRDPPRLQQLVTDFNHTAQAFAVRQSQLSDAIYELPRTLSAAMPALAAVNAALPNLRRLSLSLLPAVRSTPATADVAIPFVRQLRGLVSKPELRGLVADLRPTVPQLARLDNESVPLYQQVRAASSCQDNVILPWSHDTIQDPQFPADGPVYTETPKTLPGLAGESRAGDANGQWFSVLVSPAEYAYPNGVGGFLLTGNPIQGVNPPPPTTRPPLRPQVPCETQQPPDLRTVPAGPPAGGFQVTLPNTPAAQAQYARAQLTAVNWLRGVIDQQGLGNVLKVSDTPIDPSVIPHLKQLGTMPPVKLPGGGR